MEWLDIILQYAPDALLTIAGLLVSWKGAKYLLFVKEVFDIFKAYKTMIADSVNTDAEKLKLANEIIEAVESYKGLRLKTAARKV